MTSQLSLDASNAAQNVLQYVMTDIILLICIINPFIPEFTIVIFIHEDDLRWCKN